MAAKRGKLRGGVIEQTGKRTHEHGQQGSDCGGGIQED